MTQNKTPEHLQMERDAQRLERQIVKFTNIDDESFTHSFRGISITVESGRTQIMRLPEGDHLAIHLARKMLAKEKKKTQARDRGINLWTVSEVNRLKKQILTNVATEDDGQVSEQEARKRDYEQLNKQYGDEDKKEEVKKEEKPKDEPNTVTKKQVIEDLKKRGVTPDVNKSKDELLKQLMDSEAQGVAEDE